MTVSANLEVRRSVAAEAVTAGVPISIAWNSYNQSEIKVTYNDDTVATLGTDYTVSIDADNVGADVTPTAALVAKLDGTNPVVLAIDMEYTQPFDASQIADLPSASIEQQLDRVVLYVLQALSQFQGTLSLSAADIGTVDPKLPTGTGLVNKTATGFGYLSSITVSTTVEFDTSTAIATSTIADTVGFIRTAGYSVVGDGGGGLWRNSGRSAPATAATLVSADGTIWTLMPEPQGYNAAAFGPSNVTDYQAILDFLSAGDVLFNPPDWSIDLTDGLTIGTRITLTGRGLLNFTAGVAGKGAITVTADGTNLQDLYLYNPNSLGNTTTGSESARPYGIEIAAHNVSVTGCRVRQFQNAISQRAGGEWYGARVHFNWCEDCLGAGEGQASSSANGEDRGDGITIWGAGATVIGNLIQLKDGQDGRVGLHAERLAISIVTPGSYDNANVTMMGNVIEGRWRRGIVIEGMTGAVAIGNVVYGSTWWALCSQTGNEKCILANNTVYWDSTHTSWGAWTPVIAPLKIYGEGSGNQLTNNTVFMKAGSGCNIGISLQAIEGVQTDCLIDRNVIEAEDATVTFLTALARLQETSGIVSVRPKFTNNVLKGDAPDGLIVEENIRPVIEGNVIESLAASPVSGSDGIVVNDADCEYPYVRDNHVTGWEDGIFFASMTGGGVCDNNHLKDCTNGIRTGSSIAKMYMRGNTFENVSGTRMGNIPSSMRPWVRGNQDQLLYGEITRNWSSITAGATATEDFTITGAAIGDFVEFASEGSLNGLVMTASVSAANTVTLVAFNPTGSAVDLASTQFRIVVHKAGGLA